MTKAAPGKEKKALDFKGSFSSFSVKDLDKSMDFYSDALGLEVSQTEKGLSIAQPGTKNEVFLYPKKDHTPASFTVFNLMVDDIRSAVAELLERGIKFEQYDGDIETDADGIHWGKESGEGPNIAWFKDPSGNILSVIEEM